MNTKQQFLAVAVVGLLALSAVPAYGVLAAAGPIDPNNGFPLWYQDTNGLTLSLMTTADPFNIAAPVIAGDAFSAQIGFGEEAFWWSAETLIALPTGGQALLVLATEATFLPAFGDGNQAFFSRVRMRIDTPAPGTYTVTYPYGTEVFRNVAAGRRGINFTADLDPITQSAVGPFLHWTAPDYPLTSPLAPGVNFLGDGLTEHAVTGSPTGNNFFRIDGPVGCGIGGPGVDFIQTDLFVVSGKVFAGAIPTALVPGRACYYRTAAGAGSLELFATSTPTAAVTVTGGPNLPQTAPITLTGNATGAFFALAPLADASVLPATVTFSAVDAINSTTTTLVPMPLMDCVTISLAQYVVPTQTLTIKATSSDLLVPPVLSYGAAALTNGQLVQTNVAIPPTSVTVTSAAGGSATLPVTLVTVAPPPPVPPQLPPPPIVAPPGQTITVQRPTFSTRGATWNLSNGRLTPAQAGVVVTVHLGADTTGPVIGAATVNNTGQWRLSIRRSPIVPSAGAVISLQASTGAKALAIPIRITR